MTDGLHDLQRKRQEDFRDTRDGTVRGLHETDYEKKRVAVEPRFFSKPDGGLELEGGGLPGSTRQDPFPVLRFALPALPNKGIPRANPGLRLSATSPIMPEIP